MNTPLVSVVMPVRNSASTLPEAVASLRQQDLKEIEIILVDHGSSDSTAELIHSLRVEDRRIRSLRSDGTFVEAINEGCRRARADLIARMDGDDVAHPNRLSKQLQLLQSNHKLDACGTRVRIRKRGHDSKKISPPEGGYQRYETWINSLVNEAEIMRERFVDSPVPNPTTMIRRSVFESLNGFSDPSWAEDYDFWLRFMEQGFRIAKVPEVLLDWYDSPDRSTRNLPRYELDQFQLAKAFYLSRVPRVRKNGVIIWGAGPIGKQMARFLAKQEIRTQLFVEVDPKKIGNRIFDCKVISPADLDKKVRDPVLLAAVGVAGAREEIRGHVLGLEKVEGEDFFCVA